MSINVVATRNGHYGDMYRRPGDVFTVTKSRHLSKKWMLPADSSQAKKFLAGLSAREEARDSLTGERVASGGTEEQLAIEMEKNAALEERIARLEALLGDKDDGAEEPDEEVETDDEDDTEEADDADEDEVDEDEEDTKPAPKKKAKASAPKPADEDADNTSDVKAESKPRRRRRSK